MRKSWTVPTSVSNGSVPFRLGVILLLVICGLVVQYLWGQVVQQTYITQEEFIEDLRSQGVEVANMGVGVAPLTIYGERLRLSGGEVVEPVEITVYEDLSDAVDIKNNIITSQVSNATPLWVHRDGARRSVSAQVIDVSQWSVPLHVFQRGPLIVLYGGSDMGVLNVLSKALGREVAGP